MSQLGDFGKRILVGRALSSEQLHETLLPKRIAPARVRLRRPVVQRVRDPGDPLVTLAIGGATLYQYGPGSPGSSSRLRRRRVVPAERARPTRRAAATTRSWHQPRRQGGVFVASALLVDYVLTVAVSISSAVANVRLGVPAIGEHKVFWAVGVIVLIVIMNLRGVRESARRSRSRSTASSLGIFGMVGYAIFRILRGDSIQAESAELDRRRRGHVHGPGAWRT